MGRKKFRLSVHRKNEERKTNLKKLEMLKQTVEDPSLTVTIPRNLITISSFKISFPVSVYRDRSISSVDQLYSRLTSFPLPKSWIFASSKPLVLSKVCVNPRMTQANVLFTLTIDDQLEWSLLLHNVSVDLNKCPLLRAVPHTLNSASDVHKVLNFVDTSKICTGNSEQRLLDQWQRQSLTLHGSYGSKRGFVNDLSLPTGATVRHEHCQLLLSSKSSAVRCLACSALRASLTVQATRKQGTNRNCSTPCNHTNYSRMSQMHHQYRLVSKQLDRLKKKIAESSELSGVALDQQTHDDFKNIMTSSTGSVFFESLPKDSFQYIFWQQQLEAARKRRPRTCVGTL